LAEKGLLSIDIIKFIVVESRTGEQVPVGLGAGKFLGV